MLKVIGLGNCLRGDDGIGPYIIHNLQQDTIPKDIKLYNMGADPFSVLEKLLEPEPLLIVDCARMGLKPGSVRRISARKKGFRALQLGLSLHGFDLAHIWRIALSMGANPDLILIGVEPENLDYHTGLSDPVQKSVPTVLKMVEEEAKKYAQ